MQRVKLLVDNSIILSLVDDRLAPLELKSISSSFLKKYWFYEDLVDKEELIKLMKNSIARFKTHDVTELNKHFEKNTDKLSRLIPVNQKIEHIKAFISLVEVEGLLAVEEDLIQKFETKFLDSIENEYSIKELSLEQFKLYVVTLIHYGVVDILHHYEEALIKHEIETYFHLNDMDEDLNDFFEDAKYIVESYKFDNPQNKFVQNSKDLILAFNDEQDNYFIKVLEQLKDADKKISVQEMASDRLHINAKNIASRVEAKTENLLEELFSLKRVFPEKLPAKELQKFHDKLIHLEMADNLEMAFLALENAFVRYYRLIKFSDESQHNSFYVKREDILDFHSNYFTNETLLELFKNKKMDIERLTYLRKLLNIKKIKKERVHVLNDKSFEELIMRMAIVYNFYNR